MKKRFTFIVFYSFLLAALLLVPGVALKNHAVAQTHTMNSSFIAEGTGVHTNFGDDSSPNSIAGNGGVAH